jgi:hypothetical protein
MDKPGCVLPSKILPLVGTNKLIFENKELENEK